MPRWSLRRYPASGSSPVVKKWLPQGARNTMLMDAMPPAVQMSHAACVVPPMATAVPATAVMKRSPKAMAKAGFMSTKISRPSSTSGKCPLLPLSRRQELSRDAYRSRTTTPSDTTVRGAV